MTMKKFKPFALLLTLAIAGCAKNDPTTDDKLSGKFAGRFTTFNSNPAYNSITHTGDVTVTFTESSYQSSGNSNYIPAGGVGTFSINRQQLIFNDPNVHTANFDSNLLLNGTYDYSISKDTLVMDKVIATQHYKYVLVKQ